MGRRSDDGGVRSGNALEDGYTCLGRRPRSASPGDMMEGEQAASDREEMDAWMGEYGGRDSIIRRRHQRHDDY